jgi:hypothetical protein
MTYYFNCLEVTPGVWKGEAVFYPDGDREGKRVVGWCPHSHKSASYYTPTPEELVPTWER